VVTLQHAGVVSEYGVGFLLMAHNEVMPLESPPERYLQMPQVQSLAISDVKVITPSIVRDERGFFSETYSCRALEQAGIHADFVQDNQSLSRAKGVLRGLHFQTEPFAQGKLVRVLRGSIFDVAVDIRHGSPTFGQHVSYVLSAENWSQMWVPVGFAHGFCTLEPNTEVIYKVTAFYAPQCDKGIAFDDPDIGIAWPVPHGELVLSDKDQRRPRLRDLPAAFTYAAG
jgi:dTDP-4-dehydrorhamnose 3,5-epimerase